MTRSAQRLVVGGILLISWAGLGGCPNGTDTQEETGAAVAWPEADRYCGALASNSSSVQWRLPTIDELAALYDASMEEPCGPAAICRIAPALHLSSPYLWSATAPQSERRAYYDFSLGSQLAPLIRPTLTRGVLCAQGA